MNYLNQQILAILNEWQGATLSAEQVALILNMSDVEKVRHSLEMLADAHYPVVKSEEGYTIPKNKLSDYIAGIGIFTGLLSLPLFF